MTARESPGAAGDCPKRRAAEDEPDDERPYALRAPAFRLSLRK